MSELLGRHPWQQQDPRENMAPWSPAKGSQAARLGQHRLLPMFLRVAEVDSVLESSREVPMDSLFKKFF